MFIVIKKIVGTNRFDYPDEMSLFPNGFSHPDNAEELVAENNSGKTLEELSNNVPYEVVAYEVPMKRKIPLITKRSFMQRLTMAERIAFRNSTDDIAIDIHEDLKIASNVDLDLQAVADGLGYMASIGILEASRIPELLVDGTPNEEYKGL